MIIAKKRMLDCPVTKPDLISMFGALGILVEIEHSYNDYLIKINIKENEQNLEYDTILELLNDNIRAHVVFHLEKRMSVNCAIHTAGFMESCAIYRLKTRFADRNLNTVLYAANRMETHSELHLKTMSI